MNIELKTISNGIQHINRLSFTGADNETIYIDLWEEELLSLKELIEEHYTPHHEEVLKCTR